MSELWSENTLNCIKACREVYDLSHSSGFASHRFCLIYCPLNDSLCIRDGKLNETKVSFISYDLKPFSLRGFFWDCCKGGLGREGFSSLLLICNRNRKCHDVIHHVKLIFRERRRTQTHQKAWRVPSSLPQAIASSKAVCLLCVCVFFGISFFIRSVSLFARCGPIFIFAYAQNITFSKWILF